ncbi:MAG: hypothetical protein ABJQ34_17905, partial [Paracoccaceae bacterium]
LRYSVLFELIRKPNALVHIRLSLVPKLPSKPSANLGAPHRLRPRRGAMGKLWRSKPSGATVEKTQTQNELYRKIIRKFRHINLYGGNPAKDVRNTVFDN